jgi:spoIIIJ-associated protein
MLTKVEIPKGKLVSYIIASATCFPAIELKEIDGEHYIDGGFYDNLPINLAVEMGADEIIAVDLSAIEAKETPATNYLKSILEGMGFSGVTVTAKETDEDIFFEINCEEDYGNIIGRRGETLDALQYLTRLFVNRFENNDKRVALNVGDYRSRREETLRALAKRQANKVLKYKKSTALEPMNPYERRIIHTAIQEIEGVTSHSVGEGDRRRVVITPEGGERRGNGRGDRRGNGRQKRAPYVPETPAEPREKKVDVSTSLYGRIEPKKKPEETTAE